MNIPKYARYDYCNRRACEFLEEYDINSFPIDVEKLIYDNKWGLTKYSEIMKKFSCDLETVIRCLRSKDGYTQLDDDNYSIAYNDAKQLGNRKRFTLMHEIGHIYLRHLTDFETTRLYRGSLTKEENRVLENEANAFARNVLVPSVMLQQLKNKSASNIARQFGITVKASETRLDLYQKDLYLNEINFIMPRLSIIFYNFYYKKRCLTCENSAIGKSINFCPICGQNTLKWGDGKMIYPKIAVNEKGKPKRCPICDNEETLHEGNYCQICGTYLLNECSDEECGSTLPSNARYCPLCGAKSLFLRNEILNIWNYQPKSNGFMNIPDEYENIEIPDGVLDEGLPFHP